MGPLSHPRTETAHRLTHQAAAESDPAACLLKQPAFQLHIISYMESEELQCNTFKRKL